MPNKSFSFRQFTVNQDKCAMKVGTDGVLLGAWAEAGYAAKVLDVGAGTGVIAMMIAQRSGALIDAVEINEMAFLQAQENVAQCPWKNRITVYHQSFQHFTDHTTFHYDLIVSNPPFFRDSLKSPIPQRNLARHNEQLDYESILCHAGRILTPNGRVSLIIPYSQINAVIQSGYFQGLFPVRILKIRPVASKNYNRCLVEFVNDSQCTCTENELLVRDELSKAYTTEYKALTSDYYPGF
jgi:tRNA1Val (adenine37-N6)-methyltransferase